MRSSTSTSTAALIIFLNIGHTWIPAMGFLQWALWGLVYEVLTSFLPSRLTIGKRLCGVRLYSMTGGIPPWGHAALRAVVMWGPMVVLAAGMGFPWFGQRFVQFFGGSALLMVGVLIAYVNSMGRGFPDLAAGTHVAVDRVEAGAVPADVQSQPRPGEHRPCAGPGA